MNDTQQTGLRRLALRGEEAAKELTGMVRELQQFNTAAPLPEGFADHAADLLSARSTLLRVCDEIRAATAQPRVCA